LSELRPTLIQLHRGPVADPDDFGRRCAAVAAPFDGRVLADLGDATPGEIAATLAARAETVYVSQGAGFTGEDMLAIRKGFECVLGLPVECGGSGFPSPFTALGAFAAIRGCVGDVSGVRVAVLGTGFVGSHLVTLLAEAGAEVYAADLDRAKAVATGAIVVEPDELFDVPCDVFSPNARGPAITRETAPRLNCAFVAGAANGQLESPSAGAFLIGRGIRYVPEEIAGSGWILSLAAELDPGGFSEEGARARVMTIEGLAC
jgi:leucine dehydrogenase